MPQCRFERSREVIELRFLKKVSTALDMTSFNSWEYRGQSVNNLI